MRYSFQLPGHQVPSVCAARTLRKRSNDLFHSVEDWVETEHSETKGRWQPCFVKSTIYNIYIHQNDFNVTLEHVCQVCVHPCLLLEHRVKCWVIDVDDSMTLRSPHCPKCFYSVKNGNNATSHLLSFKNDKCKSSDVSRVVHRHWGQMASLSSWATGSTPTWSLWSG